MSLCSHIARFSFFLQVHVLFGDISGWISASIRKCHWFLLAQALYIFSDLNNRVKSINHLIVSDSL